MKAQATRKPRAAGKKAAITRRWREAGRKAAHTRKWREAERKAAKTARWAVTMAQVRIRRVLARTRWQLVTFLGPEGGESRGIVDLLAIRKDHREHRRPMKRGDALQMILIQVKGGSAPRPTADDAQRLRAVASRHRVQMILLASWMRGTEAKFDRLPLHGRSKWVEVTDIDEVFR